MAEKILNETQKNILLNNVSQSMFIADLAEKLCIAGFYAMKLYSPPITVDQYAKICVEKVKKAIVDSLEDALNRYSNR